MALVLGCVLTACGPQVSFPNADDGVDDTDGNVPGTTTDPGTTSLDTSEPDEPDFPEPPPATCFEQRVIWQGQGNPRLALADTLGTGIPELWLVHPDSAIGLVRVGQAYEPYGEFPIESPFAIFNWADLDADGRDDVLGYGISPSGLDWRAKLTDAAGVPSSEVELSMALDRYQGSSVAFFDVNGDARADCFTSESGLLQIRHGDGTGAFSPMANTPLQPWTNAFSHLPSRVDHRVFAAYLYDGSFDSSVVALFGVAPGGALARSATSEPLQTDDMPILLDVRPINADARPDVAIQHRVDDHEVVSVLLAANDGDLVLGWQSPPIDTAAVGDFDGDGWLDIVWSRHGQAFTLPPPPQPHQPPPPPH